MDVVFLCSVAALWGTRANEVHVADDRSRWVVGGMPPILLPARAHERRPRQQHQLTSSSTCLLSYTSCFPSTPPRPSLSHPLPPPLQHHPQFHATARTDGIRAVGFDIDRTLPLPAAGHLPWASQSEAPAPPASPPRRRRRLWFPPLPRALAALGSSTRLYAHVRYRAVVIPATWGLPPAVAAGLAAASPSSPAPVASAAAVVDATAAANGGGGKNLRPTPAPPPPASVLPVLEEDGHVVGVVSGEPEADRSWTTVSSFGVQHVVRWGRSARGGVSFRAGITADGEFVYGVRLF